MAVIEEIGENDVDYHQVQPLPEDQSSGGGAANNSVGVADGEGAGQPQPQQSFMEKMSGMFFRMMMIYMVNKHTTFLCLSHKP